MKCSECAHWKPKISYQSYNRDCELRLCERILFGSNVEDTSIKYPPYKKGANGHYTADPVLVKEWRDAQTKFLNDQMAVVEDASGYSASFYSGPNFFCALFQQKENDK